MRVGGSRLGTFGFALGAGGGTVENVGQEAAIWRGFFEELEAGLLMKIGREASGGSDFSVSEDENTPF